MTHVCSSSFGLYVSNCSCRRLADALDGGVASTAAKHAVEALHHLAIQLPASRDLILATRALDKLVVLLQESLTSAHYAMLKVLPPMCTSPHLL